MMHEYQLTPKPFREKGVQTRARVQTKNLFVCIISGGANPNEL